MAEIRELYYQFSALLKAGNEAAALKFIESNPHAIHDLGAAKKTVLHKAAEFGSVVLIKQFLEMGLDINVIGGARTPLADACRSGMVDAAKLLLSRGANPNIGRVAFSALRAGEKAPEILELLCNNGLQVNTVFLMFEDPNNRMTALDFATNDSCKNVLTKHGALPAKELPDVQGQK